MRSVEWIVLDDLKTNLIAALMVLVLAASFTKAVELPFALARIQDQLEAGNGQVKTTEIHVRNLDGTLLVRIGDRSAGFGESAALLRSINPGLPAVIAVEEGSSLSYDQFLTILSVLKSTGVRNVSLVVQKP